MRIIQILILVIIPYSASQALEICRDCVLRNMQPYCEKLSQAGLLQDNVTRLQTEKDGTIIWDSIKGKVCENILADRVVDKIQTNYYAEPGGGNFFPKETPKTFCQFLIESQLVYAQQRENCITFYRTKPSVNQ